jgi:DNA polymerase-3 subunit alpha
MSERVISNVHQHSCLSFNDGICSPDEIITAAQANGLKSIAITDHGHTHAHARFWMAAKKAGIKGILGTEAYVIHSLKEWNETKDRLRAAKQASKAEAAPEGADEQEFDLEKALKDKAARKVLYRKGHLVMLAQNRTGLSNIYKLTYGAHKFGYFNKPRMDKEMLKTHSEGIVASSACMGGVISSKVSQFTRGECEWSEVVREAQEFSEIFPGRFFLELQSNEAAYQKVLNEHLIRIHRETKIPLIVTMDAHYVDPNDWQSQQILHMLLTHRGKEGLTFKTLPQNYEFDVRSLYIKSADQLWDQFRMWNPEVPEDLLAGAFENTLLADSLIDNFDPDTTVRLPSLPYEDTFLELKNSAVRGLMSRNLQSDDRYMERLGYELGVIRGLGIANYFLVVRNICDAARKEMLIGPGRGSAAGSLICYLTGITNIDPIEHKLMFERFINVDRIELPDIDLDFQDVDRVKDILRRDFGEDNVACISTYGTSQIKGLMKDVCRVNDIDHSECNRVNALIDREMKALYAEKEGETRSAIQIKLEDVYRLSPSFRGFVAKYPQIEVPIKSLYGREHHVGRHASGVVIGDDLPAETSIFRSKGIVQASFTDGIVDKSLSAMGLVKFDILGLATLSVIDRCLRLVASRHGKTYEEVYALIEPKNLDFNDMHVMKEVFWKGHTCGIFQVTSEGMRKLLMRVQPTCFDDVAACGALYRPGPLGSGMDRMYADRKHGVEKVTYDHPMLEEILKDTYGCFVYQEHILELGRKLGKLSWKDTNRLRKLFLKRTKDASGKRTEEADELKNKLAKGFIENGLTQEWADKTWKELEAWAAYGFNAAHAKSYGMVTMQTAYLRTYYPTEFFAALISSGQSIDLQTAVNDIKKQGFNILPVDVNLSKSQPVIEDKAVRLPFSAVKGIGASAMTKIVANQPYTSLENFLLDSGANKTAIEALIKIGALIDLCPGLSVGTQLARHEAIRNDRKLVQKKNREIVGPTLADVWGPKDDPVDLMAWERELLGFNLRGTPFSINGRADKVERLVEEGLCARGLADFIADESQEILVVPLMIKHVRDRAQKNGKAFAFLKLADCDGTEIEAPAFAGIWEHVSSVVRAGDVYIMIIHRKESDPTSYVVGQPGWKQTAKSAAAAFIPIDKVNL